MQQKTHEVYEEDKYGNTWLIAQFKDKPSAEFFQKRMYKDDETVKIREIKVEGVRD